MSTPYASGKNAIAECDRCGQRFKLKQLRALVIKTKKTNVLVCPACWDPDHPQLLLGMYPISDPQALRDPRPDTSYSTTPAADDGTFGAGSRDTQWGWAPVGGGNALAGTPNRLVAQGAVGTVTVVIS